jgi:hypothetical protein
MSVDFERVAFHPARRETVFASTGNKYVPINKPVVRRLSPATLSHEKATPRGQQQQQRQDQRGLHTTSAVSSTAKPITGVDERTEVNHR